MELVAGGPKTNGARACARVVVVREQRRERLLKLHERRLQQRGRGRVDRLVDIGACDGVGHLRSEEVWNPDVTKKTLRTWSTLASRIWVYSSTYDSSDSRGRGSRQSTRPLLVLVGRPDLYRTTALPTLRGRESAQANDRYSSWLGEILISHHDIPSSPCAAGRAHSRARRRR